MQRISFSSDPKTLSEPPTPVPCCGAFLYRDVDLTAKVIQQVDVANAQVNNGHVDAFLTATTCTKLFTDAYDGSAVQPLCKVYIGPVSAGMVSPRQTVPSGIYGVFVQAWALNDTASLSSDVKDRKTGRR